MSATIQITVKDTKGLEKLLTIKKSDTIAKGKSQLGHGADIVWKYEGEVLKENKTFEDYEFEGGDTIIASARVIGGKFK